MCATTACPKAVRWLLFSMLDDRENLELKEKLLRSIEIFILANTDAAAVPERTELILLRSALEKSHFIHALYVS
jgi:hypothetical protein